MPWKNDWSSFFSLHFRYEFGKDMEEYLSKLENNFNKLPAVQGAMAEK